MIYKYRTRCRKLTHRFQADMMTLIRESEKYFSEGFRAGRYGRLDAGAWHMSYEDGLERSRAVLDAMESVAMQHRLDDTGSAKYVLRQVCEAGWRCGIEQYAREDLKKAAPEERSRLRAQATIEREHLIDEAFETYWNDTWGDPKMEE